MPKIPPDPICRPSCCLAGGVTARHFCVSQKAGSQPGRNRLPDFSIALPWPVSGPWPQNQAICHGSSTSSGGVATVLRRCSQRRPVRSSPVSRTTSPTHRPSPPGSRGVPRPRANLNHCTPDGGDAGTSSSSPTKTKTNAKTGGECTGDAPKGRRLFQRRP